MIKLGDLLKLVVDKYEVYVWNTVLNEAGLQLESVEDIKQHLDFTVRSIQWNGEKQVIIINSVKLV